MKRILICASRMSHIINFHLPYIEHFKGKGYAVDIAAEGAKSHALTDRCFDMQFVKNPLSAKNLKTVRKLKRLISENEYTMVYSNSTLAGAALRLAVKGTGKKKRPYCVHISHGYMFDTGSGLHSFIYRTAEKLTAGVTDSLVVMNGEDLELARRYKLGKNIYFTNGMGLVAERFPVISREERTAFRSSLNLNDDSVLFLCVGEFSKRKNQTLLINALEKLHLKYKNAVLVFAGDGGTLNECRSLVSSLELDGRVRFLGHTKDVNTLYRSCDVLISGALMEGLPFNVMEALHCGMPVIASDIKGHSDLITDGTNGLLFIVHAKDTVSELSKAISSYMDNDRLQNKLKANAFLDKKYYIDSVEPKLLSILDKDFDETQIKSPEVSYL
ncbi:MAG: glycosyltransferase [Clostridia bacterium]|nr:glycosyltransferase [Clostridia bacterium]